MISFDPTNTIDYPIKIEGETYLLTLQCVDPSESDDKHVFPVSWERKALQALIAVNFEDAG